MNKEQGEDHGRFLTYSVIILLGYTSTIVLDLDGVETIAFEADFFLEY